MYPLFLKIIFIELEELVEQEKKDSKLAIVHIYSLINKSAITLVSMQSYIVNIGRRVVEINENHFLQKIGTLLKKNIQYSKIPGPWKEEIKEDDIIISSKLKNNIEETKKLLINKKMPESDKKSLENIPLRNFQEVHYCL